MDSALEKIRDAQKNRPVVSIDSSRDTFSDDYPLLFGLLAEANYRGKSVKTGSVILIIEDGAWKAVVNDRELMRCGFITAPTFNDLLQRVETGLGDGTIDWRGAASARPGWGKAK